MQIPVVSEDLSKRTLSYFIKGLSAAEHEDDWNAAAEKFMRNRHLVLKALADIFLVLYLNYN